MSSSFEKIALPRVGDTLGRERDGAMITGRRAWGRGAHLRLFHMGVLAAALAVAVALVGCAGGGSSSSNTTPSLAQLQWCDQPSINFQDDATTSQATITDWSKVRDQLGFTTYLPATFPKGTCLIDAGGSIHDPLYGGHFDISYKLPNDVPIAFSEAPKRADLGNKVQCTSSAQDVKTTICLGIISNTSVTIATRQSQSAVQAIFSSLQANVDWTPSNTNTLLATPSPTSSSGS